MEAKIDIDFPMDDKRYRYKLPAACGSERGHRGRFSDSSMYDEVCVLCGRTDSSSSYYHENCLRAVSDAVAQAARDADPDRKPASEAPPAPDPIPGNEWIASAPGQGVGGLDGGAVGTPKRTFRTVETETGVAFQEVDPEAELEALASVPQEPVPTSVLRTLSQDATPGLIAVSPFVLQSGDKKIADLVVQDAGAPLGFRLLASGLQLENALFIMHLWNNQRRSEA